MSPSLAPVTWPKPTAGRDVVVVHPGVQHSGDLAAAIERHGRLLALATGLQFGLDSTWPFRMSQFKARTERRRVAFSDSRVVRVRPLETVVERLISRVAPVGVRDPLQQAVERRFNREVIDTLPTETRVVIGTDYSSEVLFEHLRVERPDVTRILDVSHPVDVVRQHLVRRDAARWGLTPRAYDDFRESEPIDQSHEFELADIVLVASEFSARSLPRNWVPRSKLRVVPYGYDAPRKKVSDTKPGGRKLTFVGSLSERKGVTLLLRAFERLLRRDPSWKLTLVGRESAEFRLPYPLPRGVSHLSELNNAQVRRELLAADLLVLPSMCEGFGRVLLESLAAGTPTLSTECSGAPDILARCPNAPVTVINVDDRDMLDDVMASCIETKWSASQFEAVNREFSRSAYESRLQAAIP